MYTKEEVIAGRKCGLKRFDEAVSRVPIATLLDKGIEEAEYALQRRPTSAWQEDKWDAFEWGFSQAWRGACKKWFTGCGSFNLDEALTQEQIDYVAEKMSIKEPYLRTTQRKGLPYKKVDE